MRRTAAILLGWLWLGSASSAEAPNADAPASDASVRELMAVSDMAKLVGDIEAQTEVTLQAAANQMLQGREVTPGQRAIVEDMVRQMAAILSDAMSWQVMEGKFAEIYRRSFSEAEVRAMIDFYRSPGGQAVLRKMPVVMQASMELAAEQIASVAPKLRELQRQTTARLAAECGSDCTQPNAAAPATAPDTGP